MSTADRIMKAFRSRIPMTAVQDIAVRAEVEKFILELRQRFSTDKDGREAQAD